MRITNPHLKPGQKQVIIVGGGFGGVHAAKELANRDDLQVVLIDQRNYHLFQPLLYQVASAALNPSDIAVPIRGIFTKFQNISVHLGRVEKVNLKERTITGGSGEQLSYDYLILACGVRHSYFGKPAWENFAPGLKTLEQATEIRRRILSAFELAENEPDPAKQKALLTFVIVGAGPTGVELAGAIAEIATKVLVDDFRNIKPETATVLLLEMGPRALTMFAEDLSRQAAKDLKDLGVELRTGVKVDSIDEKGVVCGDTRIESPNVFWAAGVEADEISKSLGVELDRAGRIVIGPDLSIPGHPEVFVSGDLAHLEIDGKVMPGLAQFAIQTGKFAAKNIKFSMKSQPRKTFKYNDKGQMATIGKRKAVLQTKSIKMHGYFAWLAWLLVHLLSLVGFRNKMTVLTEWFWSYVFSKRGARLITQKEWRFGKDLGPTPTPLAAPAPLSVQPAAKA
ncbi:MAG: NAD(P)/FAD-dependent oxidoreductase [Chitinophagaceae bacterium]|nr:NAD(P)/FAD-dependent oxidoreductase [Oligoflexus sp.]